MIEAIIRRRSHRSFEDRKIGPEKLDEILKAAMFAPTARDRRPVEFIVVQDRGMIARLSKMTPYSGFAKDAPAVIVICYDAERGGRFKEDCSISAAHIYLEATNQGLGACFVQLADAELGPELKGALPSAGGPEELIKKELAIPDRFRLQCMMPIGYPARALAPHDDSEFNRSRIHREKY
ncbi:MAG: nitroreductase family protein [Nitrospiraceae bacterium]|nr:nitroreductase family protein [Nitrospiraceae bacterium]